MAKLVRQVCTDIPIKLIDQFDRMREEKFPDLSRQQVVRAAMARAITAPDELQPYVGKY